MSGWSLGSVLATLASTLGVCKYHHDSERKVFVFENVYTDVTCTFRPHVDLKLGCDLFSLVLCLSTLTIPLSVQHSVHHWGHMTSHSVMSVSITSAVCSLPQSSTGTAAEESRVA